MKILLRLFNIVIFPLTLVLGLLLTLSGLAPNFSAESGSVMALLGLAFPVLFLLNALLLLYWALQLKWRTLFPLAFGLLHLGQASLYVQWNDNQSTDEAGLRVATYNTQLLGHYSGEGSEDSLKQLMQNHPADVYCFQELYDKGRNMEALMKRLARSVGFRYHAHYQLVPGRPYGMGIISRYEILKSKPLLFGDSSGNMAMWANVRIPSQQEGVQDWTVRVYNVHLQSFRLHRSDYDLVSEGFESDSTQVERSKGLVQRLSKAYSLRSGQAEILRQSLDECPHTKLVMGDFNDVPVSYSYRLIARSLRDAFVESGRGLEGTYKGPFPSFRIDYVLFASPLKCLHYQSHSQVPGDHKWVEAGFSTGDLFAN